MCVYVCVFVFEAALYLERQPGNRKVLPSYAVLVLLSFPCARNFAEIFLLLYVYTSL